MAKKQEKTPIIIDEQEYFFEDMTPEQQAIINHISDLTKDSIFGV